MAIIKCSECGGQVSTLAEKCPHCGCPVNSSNAEATANNSSASASVPTPSNSSKPKNRKLIWSIFAVIVAAIVGVALYFAVGSKSDSEDAAKTYAIGDYYNENGKEGIVFDVWDGGRHGKIVSLDEKAGLEWCTYWQREREIMVGADNHDDGKYNTDMVMRRRDSEEYPPFVWCREKGEDWYLPATNELKLIVENRSKINSTLRKLDYDVFSSGEYSYYWSSTEEDEFFAWFVRMDDGYTFCPSKDWNGYVRAVSAF